MIRHEPGRITRLGVGDPQDGRYDQDDYEDQDQNQATEKLEHAVRRGHTAAPSSVRIEVRIFFWSTHRRSLAQRIAPKATE
jgi:hypothetical protein